MQLRGDEAGLFSHKGELLLKSGEKVVNVFRLHQKSAEQYHRPDVMFNLFRKGNLIVHLDDFQ